MAEINEHNLDERMARLESVNNWSPRVISKLESFICTADDYSLFRVDPIRYATEKSISENEAIDLFLHASKIGLFDLEWNVVCTCCSHVYTSLKDMANIHPHFLCSICAMKNNAGLDEAIQVSFTIAPSIRTIVYHNPNELSAPDYVVRYSFMPEVKRTPGLGYNADYLEKYAKAVNYLEPGEKIELEFDVSPGFLFVSDLIHNDLLALHIAPPSDNDAMSLVQMRFGMPDLEVISPPTKPYSLDITKGDGEHHFLFEHFSMVPEGKIKCVIENLHTDRACISIANMPPDLLETWIEMPAFLSGKRLLNTQTFRNLYRAVVMDESEGLSVRDITFLFTDLKGSTQLYDKLGDLKAYHLVRQHFEALTEVIMQNSGAVIKTIGDAIMASFNTPLEGLRCALEILQTIEKFNNGHADQLILKVGLHSGHSIAVTLNERLDYFGQTVNIAARVQALAEANEIYISKCIYDYPGVSQMLENYMITPANVNVKGVSDMLQLYKISVLEKTEPLLA